MRATPPRSAYHCRLRALLAARNLSQRGLAKQCGISEQWLTLVLRGYYRMPEDLRARMEKVLKVAPGTLQQEQEGPKAA